MYESVLDYLIIMSEVRAFHTIIGENIFNQEVLKLHNVYIEYFSSKFEEDEKHLVHIKNQYPSSLPRYLFIHYKDIIKTPKIDILNQSIMGNKFLLKEDI